MKITTLFASLAVCSISASTYAQSLKLSINKKNSSISEVFKDIEKKSDFTFFFNDNQINVNRRVNVNAKNADINDVLKQTLKDTNYSYEIIGKQILIKVSDKTLALVPDAVQQSKIIKGKVIDAAGIPVIGANVVVKGTTNGTITDMDGNFSLEAEKGATLVISYIGYTDYEIIVDNQESLAITLQEDNKALDEVVVIGYGAVKKRDLTGAVATVKPKDMEKMALNDVSKALVGKVSGVLVNESVTPGGSTSILIRGKRSITAGNDPLLVVDGTPIIGNLSDFPVSDIKSMEVLKDASATAIYGSRAANGVIIITTKKGSFGQKGKVTYSGYYGVQVAAKKQSYMNAAQYMERNRWYEHANGRYEDPANPTLEADKKIRPYSNAYVSDLWADPSTRQLIDAAYAGGQYDPSKLIGTDWVDLQTRTGYVTDHQVSFSGGNDNVNAYVSGGFYRNEGISIWQEYQRFNLRANVDLKVKKWWKINFTSATTISDNPSKYDSEKLYAIPVSTVRKENGDLNLLPGNDGLAQSFSNPLLDINGVSMENKSTRFLQTVTNTLDIIKGLNFKMLLSFDGTYAHQGRYDGQYSSKYMGETTDRGIGMNSAAYSRSSSISYLMENTLNYATNFNGKHNFGAMIGWTMQSFNGESVSTRGENNPIDYQEWHNMGGYTDNIKNSSGKSKSGLQSFLTRVNYSYMDKYLLTATFRIDGSSVFSSGKKYDYFPSFSAGWKINEEDFMKDFNNIDQLKLRLGYGVTGNSAVSPGQTLGTIVQTAYVLGRPGSEIPLYGYAPHTLPSPLRWEQTKQWNIGTDFSFWNGRLSGSLDGYVAKTTDLIMPRKLPVAASGLPDIVQNIGQTSNRGVELSLSSVNIESSDFRWSTDLVLSYNKESIDRIYKEGDDIDNEWFIGHPLNVVYDYKYERLLDSKLNSGDQELIDIKNKAEGTNKYQDGDVLVKDLNGDNKITADKDRYIIGKQRPDVVAGLTNNLSYKDFELSFMFFGKFGSTIWSGFNCNDDRDNGPVINYWTPNNRNADYPRLGASRPHETNSRSWVNGSFVRLRNVNITYNIPSKILNKIKMDQLSVYASVQNPNLVIKSSKFKGLDPEFSPAIGGYSHPTTISFGLKLGF